MLLIWLWIHWQSAVNNVQNGGLYCSAKNTIFQSNLSTEPTLPHFSAVRTTPVSPTTTRRWKPTLTRHCDTIALSPDDCTLKGGGGSLHSQMSMMTHIYICLCLWWSTSEDSSLSLTPFAQQLSSVPLILAHLKVRFVDRPKDSRSVSLLFQDERRTSDRPPDVGKGHNTAILILHLTPNLKVWQRRHIMGYLPLWMLVNT